MWRRWRRTAALPGASRSRLGSLQELFGHPVWGRRAIFGLLLAVGVFVVALSLLRVFFS